MACSIMAQWSRGRFAALLLLWVGACAGGRASREYDAFVASHDALRPGMSMQQAFAAGLADYLVELGGKTVSGATLPVKQPVSPDCRRHVFQVHYGSGDVWRPGGFSTRVYCNMNGPSDRQVTPPRVFKTREDFLAGLGTDSSSARSMQFAVESPPLQIGGVYDRYTFSTDESGRLTTVSAIRRSAN